MYIANALKCIDTIDIDNSTPQAPVITSNLPQDIQIPEGHHLLLEVTVCGTMPLYYQWYFGYITIAGMLYMIIYMNITI